MNRKMDESIETLSILISKKESISCLIQRTALSPPAHETAPLQWMTEGP
jgi:hypothetical protein